MVSKQQALAKKAKAKARSASNSTSSGPSSLDTASRPAAECVPVLIQLLNALSTNISLLDSELVAPTLAIAPSDFDAENYATQLHAVGAHIHHAITKFTLLHREEGGETGARGPPVETSKAEVKSLVTLATQLVAHVASRPRPLGRTIRELHFRTAREILLAVSALVEGFVTALSGDAPVSLATGSTTSATDRALAQYLLDTGVAWKSADLIKDLPLTNRAAVCKAWKVHAELAKDVLAEVKESVEEFEMGDGSAEGDNDFFSDEEDEDDGGNADPVGSPMSEEDKKAELARLGTIVKLVTLSSSFATKVTSFLSTSTPSTSLSPNNVSALDALPETASALAESLDELGAAVAECPLPHSGEPGYAGLRLHMGRILTLWSRILSVAGDSQEQYNGLGWLIEGSEPGKKWVGEARTALAKARQVVNKEFGADDSEGEE